MDAFGYDLPTSYFSQPAKELDPTLFQGNHLQSWVRKGIMTILSDFLGRGYRHSELWAHPWLAGSGVSFQWSAARNPGDLDCLVGVDFVQFRKANPEYRGLLDKEIADQLNEEFHDKLQPTTENWNGYELTFYVNPTATDIRAIKPYAAYDLKYDEWTVPPNSAQVAPSNPDWDAVVDNDFNTAHQVHTRFIAAVQDYNNSHAGPQRRNAEARLESIGAAGEALFDEIHENRSQAFSSSGEGYADFHNYRWQAGKRTGAIQLLKGIRDHMQDVRYAKETAQYGSELPNADTLVRRAALYRNSL